VHQVGNQYIVSQSVSLSVSLSFFGINTPGDSTRFF